MATRRNVLVIRNAKGAYDLCGPSGDYTLTISAADWRSLGLRSLRRGFEGWLDLQCVGIPKKRKRRKG